MVPLRSHNFIQIDGLRFHSAAHILAFIFVLLYSFDISGIILIKNLFSNKHSIVIAVTDALPQDIIKFLEENGIKYSKVCGVIGLTFSTFSKFIRLNINNPNVLVIGFEEYFQQIGPFFNSPRWINPYINLSYPYRRNIEQSWKKQGDLACFYIREVNFNSHLDFIKFIFLLYVKFSPKGLYITHNLNRDCSLSFNFFIGISDDLFSISVPRLISELLEEHKYKHKEILTIPPTKENIELFLSIKTPAYIIGFSDFL